MALKILAVLCLVPAVLGILPPRDAEGRALGGAEVGPDEIPWQVSIQSKNNGFPQHKCGGIIINDPNRMPPDTSRFLLTAASCLHGVSDADLMAYYQVRSGSNEYRTAGTKHTIVRRVKHKDFNEYEMTNDIAIWTVKEQFDLAQQNVGAATLADKDVELLAGEAVQVSGWGYTTESGTMTPKLLKALMSIVNRQECKEQYSDLWGAIPDKTICASVPEGGIDSCVGDTGGPLMRVSDKRIYGIVSTGNGCGRPGFSGIYTEVAKFIDWIEENSS